MKKDGYVYQEQWIPEIPSSVSAIYYMYQLTTIFTNA